MKGLVLRGLATVVVVGALGVFDTLLRTTSKVVSGEVAVHQFDNSDLSYIASQTATAHMTNIGVPVIVTLILIAWIWFTPVKNFFLKISEEN